MNIRVTYKSPLAKHQTLPAHTQGQTTARDEFIPGHETTTDAIRRTLLLVEDNPANLKLVEDLIALIPDIELLAAVNGTLGIQLARATQPQVILMDINRPCISSIKALKILRQDAKTAHIPIVALSANAMPCDIAKSPEPGFFRYLTKPIKVTQLIDTLNSALEFAEKRLLRAENARQMQ